MRLVLGVVGAVIGGIYGGPTGASWGYAIGSALGGAVDPEVIKNTGPRLDDLTVQFSTYGAMIPKVYGTRRVSGNVIWASAMRETVTTVEDDGKGPVQETTTYTYSIDLAISIGEGEIVGIRKAWANGTLLYNIGTDANGATLSASDDLADSLTVYTGTESQLPDPTIEADKGAGNVPAYRGQAYVVIKDLQLAKFGNRVPNIEFEVLAAGSTTSAGTTWVQNSAFPTITNGNPATSPTGNPNFAVDETADQIFCFYYLPDAGPRVSSTYDLTTWTTVEPSGLPTYTAYDRPAFVVFESKLYLIGGKVTPNDVTPNIYRSEDGGQTWAKVAELPNDGGGYFDLCCAGVHSGKLFVLGGTNTIGTAGATVYRTADGVNWEIANATGSGSGFDNGRNGWLLSHGGALYGMHSNPGATQRVYKSTDNGATWTQVNTSGPGTTTDFANGFVYNNTLYAFARAVGPIVYTSTDNGVTWTLLGGITPAMTAERHNTAVFGGTLLLLDWSSTPGTPDPGVQWKLYQSNTTITPSTVALSTIVSGICSSAGLTAGQIDVTALTDTVWGYVVTRQAAARGNLEVLRRCYLFDAVESDGKIKFVKRGGASAVTIPANDIGAYEVGQEPAEALEVRRMQEAEMPLVVSVNFPNVNNDYQVASETSRRLITLGEQVVREDCPVPLTPDQGAQLAEKLMYDAHISRTSFSFSTTRKYAKYEPTDVVRVTNPAGTTYEMRLTKKDESGPLIKWEGVATAQPVYSSTASGTTPVVSDPQVTVKGATNARFLDIPILRDEDNDAGFYCALGRLLSGWTGASLFKSSDQIAYSSVGSVVNSATIGTCGAALGNFAGGNIVDETNTVEVLLQSGSLSSITFDELLNEGNAALVGNELVHFRTATLLASNHYRLSGLLRGRRGTEQYISTHTSAERFVLLSVPGVLRVSSPASEISVARYYKPVSTGTSLSSTLAQAFTNTAVGLKPLSVVHVGGGKQSNGDFIITWVRRTRVDGGWRALVDAALGESSESYEIEIMQGATVKRTLTATSQTVTYTLAQQTTDFGSGVAAGALSVKIYQMSATVGRGFVTTKTL